MIPSRSQYQMQDPYRARPVFSRRLRGSDQGGASAYPSTPQNVGQPVDQQTGWMRAIERRLRPEEAARESRDRDITKKSKDGKSLPDNLKPSYLRS